MQKNDIREPGFYWARKNKDDSYYNLIVRVIGEFPFFKMDCWDLGKNVLKALDPSDFHDFGPSIIMEKVPFEKKDS